MDYITEEKTQLVSFPVVTTPGLSNRRRGWKAPSLSTGVLTTIPPLFRKERSSISADGKDYGRAQTTREEASPHRATHEKESATIQGRVTPSQSRGLRQGRNGKSMASQREPIKGSWVWQQLQEKERLQRTPRTRDGAELRWWKRGFEVERKMRNRVRSVTPGEEKGRPQSQLRRTLPLCSNKFRPP